MSVALPGAVWPDALRGNGSVTLPKEETLGPCRDLYAYQLAIFLQGSDSGFRAQVARKWDGNSADKPVLDYSQKEDGGAAAGDRQDISQPLADLSLKSRVDEFDNDEEGERIAILGQFAVEPNLARRVVVTVSGNLELDLSGRLYIRSRITTQGRQACNPLVCITCKSQAAFACR